MYNSKVIVVSGITAGGKTSLVKELIENVDNACALLLEDFKTAVNQYDITQLMDDFFLTTKKRVFEFVFIDFPFGYEHDSLKPYIDTVIYVKTPLDVSFARQVIRDYSDRDKEEIINWSKTYLNYARPIFLEHEKIVSSTADYILDGTISMTEQVNQLRYDDVI
ncbi:adenylyl-sulfate kinase [Carnobacterium maltaromaticum]|uniref:adenylyl-sulfate kinase n=1 Tax=Carnobacterium maltaromaticum TaxID=2751 RepID=UPI0012FAAC64|nr:adenylyl-sulfate kinase [Carnobacterium maltaromaticum]